MIPTSRSVTSCAPRRLFCLAFFGVSGSMRRMQATPPLLSESVRPRVHCGRTSTPNQAMQLTAVSPAFTFRHYSTLTLQAMRPLYRCS